MKKEKIIDNIDHGIIEFYLNNSTEEIVSMAKEDGFDPDHTADKRDKLAKLLKFHAQASLKKEKDQSLLERAERILISLVEKYVDKPVAELKMLLQL